MTPVAEMFSLWTLPAVLVAVASGIALGFAVRHVRPTIHAGFLLWAICVVGATWYLPLAVQRFWEGFELSAWRSIGNLLLWWLAFAAPAAIVVAWRRAA